MPTPRPTNQPLTALLQALQAIADAARAGLACTNAEDALDVILAVESAARTASLEYHGIADDDLAWEVTFAPTDRGEEPF